MTLPCLCLCKSKFVFRKKRHPNQHTSMSISMLAILLANFSLWVLTKLIAYAKPSFHPAQLIRGGLCNISRRTDQFIYWIQPPASMWMDPFSSRAEPKVKVQMHNQRGENSQSEIEDRGEEGAGGGLDLATVIMPRFCTASSSCFWPWRCPIVCLILLSYFSFFSASLVPNA